jgi:homoserine kinase type II
MSGEENNRVLEEILANIKATFGIRVIDAHLLDKGWLNVKWRLTTDRGPLFVKFYHPNRYKLDVPEKRKKIEQTLVLQQWLHNSDVPCPEVYSFEGQFIQETATGNRYAMMDWVRGDVPKPGCISDSHMYQLGQTTGRMHQLLRGVQLDITAWRPDQSACLLDLQNNMEQAKKEENRPVMEILERAIVNVQSLDFEMFSDSPVGWLHWDLWVDNLLMSEQRVAGIVDFDRMAVAYPELDIARAILSGAWGDERIRIDAVQAFMDGYREHSTAPKGILLRAIKMLYLIESVWWFRTEIYNDTGVPTRFLQEMEWLTKQWDNLSDMLLDI